MAHRPFRSRSKPIRGRNADGGKKIGNAPRRVVRDSSPGSSSGSLVMGRRCVAEVLRHAPDRIREAWILPHNTEQDGEFLELASLLRETGRPVHVADRGHLSELAQSDSHQGVVARVSDRRFENLSNWLDSLEPENSPIMVLAVDAVQDPMNFGAMLRIAECFGVSAVVWSKNRSVALSPVVAKASVGASELVPLIPVSNLQEALERFKKAGFWVVAADISADATALPTFEFPSRSVLVMGSEGKGIQPLIMKSVDFRVTIPMRGRLDSLNVSQATAILVSSWCSQVLRGGGES